ncbi:DUF805 domain-containing protein [Paenibacillus sp. GCM10027627]|uniref:DUF805 domain-containing protein n=1 Tax=unclassified Paenibacillus TaxID=185978 RepID=UPI0036448B4B
MSWYLKVFKKYATFSGRARRKEYWMFALVNFLIVILLALLVQFNESLIVLYYIFLLVVALPGIAVVVRRLHDTNRSGWWFFISFVPFGSIVILVFMCLKGETGPNRFGEDPTD